MRPLDGWCETIDYYEQGNALGLVRRDLILEVVLGDRWVVNEIEHVYNKHTLLDQKTTYPFQHNIE